MELAKTHKTLLGVTMASGKPGALTILGILVLVALAVFVVKDFVLAPGPYSNSNRAGSERGVAVEGAPDSVEGAFEVSPVGNEGVEPTPYNGGELQPTFAPGGSPGSQEFGDDIPDTFGTPTPQPTLFPTTTPKPAPSPVVQPARDSRSIRIDETVKDYNA